MVTNKRLLDVLARHQIYVEGLKADYFKHFNPTLNEIEKEIRFIFSKLRYKTMDEFTKRDLNKFLIAIRKIQKQSYNKYTESLIASLQEFMRVDKTNLKIIFATLEAEDDTKPVTENEADEILQDSDETNTMLPVAWFLSEDNEGESDKLWASVLNAPIPANGLLTEAFIASFAVSASNALENIVRKGYANRSSIEEVLTEIFGTSSLNNRDGLFNRIGNQNNAVVSTVMQHITSYVQGGISSILYGKYRWVSVIDNVTTEICKGRNNKVFKYGAGPLPPAHINCRSKTVPVVAGDIEDAPSYYAWAKEQPKEFLKDVLGSSKAEDLLSGKTKAKDAPQFSNPKPITLKEFASKLDKILSR